LNVRKLSKTRT